MRRAARKENKDRLVDVEDDVADSEEIEPIFHDHAYLADLVVRPGLDAQEEGHDGDFREPDRVDADDLPDPAVEIRFRELGAPKEPGVVAESGEAGDCEDALGGDCADLGGSLGKW